MSTTLQEVFAAPREFRADCIIGEPWETFSSDAEDYVAAHPDAVIVAATDWEPREQPLTRATRWRFEGGRVVTEAVRVDMTFALWTEEDTEIAVRAQLGSRRP